MTRKYSRTILEIIQKLPLGTAKWLGHIRKLEAPQLSYNTWRTRVGKSLASRWSEFWSSLSFLLLVFWCCWLRNLRSLKRDVCLPWTMILTTLPRWREELGNILQVCVIALTGKKILFNVVARRKGYPIFERKWVPAKQWNWTVKHFSAKFASVESKKYRSLI